MIPIFKIGLGGCFISSSELPEAAIKKTWGHKKTWGQVFIFDILKTEG